MRSILISALLCLYFSALAQDRVRDSLYAVLDGQTGSERLNTLVLLSDRILYQNPDTAIVYADEAYNLARELRETTLRYKALKIRAYANNFAGNITRSISDIQEGLDFYSRIRDTTLLAEAMSDLGQLYLSQGIFDKAQEHFQQA